MLAAVVVAGASGCSLGPSQPTAAPAPTSATSTVTTTPSSSRPRPIKLDGIDPCSLLPAQQKAQFGLDSPDVAIDTNPAQAFNNAPRCFWNTTHQAFAFELVTSKGVSAFTAGQIDGKVSTAAPINGFPALTIIPPVDDQCYTAVDVADGQMLIATIQVPDNQASTMCDFVHQFAQVGMNTLTSRN